MLKNLPHTIEILEPTYGTDAYGTPNTKATYPESGVVVPAFVQPRATREINVGAERATSTSEYIAYIHSSSVTHKARVKWNDITFEVIGVRTWDAPMGKHTAIDLRDTQG